MLTIENLEIARAGFELKADFTIPDAALVSVLGPSGAGKSTLLSAIAGFEPLRAGRILWNGRDLAPLAPGARPVSLLFQDGNLFPHLSVAENVGLGIRPARRLTAEERIRVSEALARVGLAGLGARKPGQLSGGQVARAALARMLVMHRPLMLLDEPFGALGPALKAEMRGLVADLARETGATLLMVSHDPADAHALGGTVLLVAQGVAHAPVPADEIFANPPQALAGYLGP